MFEEKVKCFGEVLAGTFGSVGREIPLRVVFPDWVFGFVAAAKDLVKGSVID